MRRYFARGHASLLFLPTGTDGPCNTSWAARYVNSGADPTAAAPLVHRPGALRRLDAACYAVWVHLLRATSLLTALTLCACGAATTNGSDATTDGRDAFDRSLDIQSEIALDALEIAMLDASPIGTACTTDADCRGGICLAIGRCTRPCTTRSDCPVGPNWDCLHPDGGQALCSCRVLSVSEVPCNGIDDDCDGIIDNDMFTCNGHCTDPDTDPSNCGACGVVCSAPAGATATCSRGHCEWSCLGDRADCNGDPSDGCEVDIVSDASSCGSCGHVCTLPNATARCELGACAVDGCSAGYGNCNRVQADGCELNVSSDVHNCGTCGHECFVPHGTPSCVDGRCGIQSCDPLYGDCDGNADNGCEVAITSATNCGMCGVRCTDPTPFCDALRCSASCSAGTICSGECVDLSADPDHCGSCTVACTVRPNAVATCITGTCQYTCIAGYGDCDGIASNGCETLLNFSPNCGGCGRICAIGPNSRDAVCDAGHCNLACLPGFADCDSEPVNGCETDLRTSVASCGTCNVPCTRAHATPQCVSGMCSIESCATGFGDCDGNDANGCETDLTTDALHCGACTTACPDGHSCTSGACI